jgi:hypothetical protein
MGSCDDGGQCPQRVVVEVVRFRATVERWVLLLRTVR